MANQVSADVQWTPPSVAFKTFLNLLEKMEGPAGVPPQIDRTFLTGAEGTKTQVIAALKAFGLIEEDLTVRVELRHLVAAKDARPAVVEELLHRFYAPANKLGTLNATQKQLDSVFESMGLTGVDTRRKAIGFYLRAANYAGIPLSPNFKKPQERKSSGPRRARTKKNNGAGETPPPPADPPATIPGDLKARYLDMLMKKAEQQEQLDEGLLDRIERALGLSEPEAKA